MKEYFDNKAKEWDREVYRVHRAEVVANEIKSVVHPDKTMSVMDFGCGTGLLGFHFIDDVENVVFVDNSHAMLEQVEHKAALENYGNYSVINTDQQPIDKKFDLIVNLMVFHHIRNYEEVVSDLIGCLNRASYFVFCDLEQEDGSFHAPETVPHNGFDHDAVRALLCRNSLEVIYEKQVFVNQKTIDGEERDFPVFLMIGKSAR